MDLRIERVAEPERHEPFLTLPWKIYQDDPLWVPPIMSEVKRRIDRDRGHFYQRGEAQFFMAWRGTEPVGRICAAEDRETNAFRNRSDCLFGFFEAVDNSAVVELLIQTAERWGKRRSLDNLLGPYHLDYEDSYGVLIEGRDRPPTVLCGHTPAYYQGFFEDMGFTPARGDALAYEMSLDPAADSLQRLIRLGDYARKKGVVQLRQADLDHWQREAELVYGLINRALAHLPNFIPWPKEALFRTFEGFLEIADPELILFAESDGELVGWLPGVPNANEVLIHANGLRRPWDYATAWWHARKQPACLALKSVLVLREYWDIGVPVLLFAEMAKRAMKKGYQWVDNSLTSADNPTTPILAKHMGAKIYKRYRVYERPIVGD